MIQGRFQPAPLFTETADGPEGGEALWLTASDGVRLRVGIWPKGANGTVLLLPGRTEYIEKYGRAAGELAARGYATAVIDWRGQGLADRLLADRMIGHVDHFEDYQLDLEAMIELVRMQGMPEPYYLMAHSMGGSIGLRGLINGMPVNAAAFSAPMWGISMSGWMRPVAIVISQVSSWIGQSHRFSPGTSEKSYVVEAPFAGNVLTTDPEVWRYMRDQIVAHPELSLAGPSLGWLREALTECHALSLMPSPDCPALTALGTMERVVDPAPIHLRMARWPKGRLDIYPGSEHEIIMERPAQRTRFFDSAASLFAANR